MSVYNLLCEALRRYTRFHEGEPLTEAWAGLGYKTDYLAALKGGYMEFVKGYFPRCVGWLRLTEKGAAIVQGWLDAGLTYQDVEAGKSLPWKP